MPEFKSKDEYLMWKAEKIRKSQETFKIILWLVFIIVTSALTSISCSRTNRDLENAYKEQPQKCNEDIRGKIECYNRYNAEALKASNRLMEVQESGSLGVEDMNAFVHIKAEEFDTARTHFLECKQREDREEFNSEFVALVERGRVRYLALCLQ